jgi:glycerol-3-phosphate dehydrogenase (NAD(P)+)
MTLNKPLRVTLLGSGSWGTALIKILTEHNLKNTGNIHSLTWWVRSEETAVYLNTTRHNPKYIPSLEIHPEHIHITTNLHEALTDADYVVLAIPSAFLHDTLQTIPATLLQNSFIVSAIKGLLPHSKQIVAEYLSSSYGVATEKLLVVSGPCHAEEVAAEKLSYLTIAGHDAEATKTFAAMLSCRFIQTILSSDITGTEYGAVLKNIYAIASGICQGLGYGDNFQAVLISNAIREMDTFLYAIHAHPRDINHSAYLGDLLVTAYSQHSRNRTFGLMLGKGYTAKQAQLEMNMIAEGYYASKTLFELNEQQLHVSMPIAEMVYQIIYQNKSPKQEVVRLCEKLI